ncbi:FixH family protein [Paenibacillus taichungensis]|uniref:FixH family protein n=1 Tax=Paenibacillus taichungensis TaxID=484184 RepID=UPI0028714612|nr:FixH family protein [Paenibacillus taichungensis]MDR9748583.1 FixH family protein [Paenibacillus taichungensis]
MNSKLHNAVSVLIIMAAVLFIASGCSDSAHNADDHVPDIIDVNIKTSPDKLVLNQPVTISATISQGDNRVSDAKEVEFEVWKWGEKNHETLKVKPQEGGVYSIERMFSSDGIYYVIAHVSARGMHNMPRRQLIVGTVSEEEIAKANANPDKSTHKH